MRGLLIGCLRGSIVFVVLVVLFLVLVRLVNAGDDGVVVVRIDDTANTLVSSRVPDGSSAAQRDLLNMRLSLMDADADTDAYMDMYPDVNERTSCDEYVRRLNALEAGLPSQGTPEARKSLARAREYCNGVSHE